MSKQSQFTLCWNRKDEPVSLEALVSIFRSLADSIAERQSANLLDIGEAMRQVGEDLNPRFRLAHPFEDEENNFPSTLPVEED